MNSTKEGIVKGGELASPLEDVVITHYDSNGNLKDKISTDESGYWRLRNITENDEISFSRQDYTNKRFSASFLPSVVRLIQKQLIGYQETLWYKPGDTVTAYIHSPESYECILYRHGLEKEAIKKLGTYSRQTQTLPDGYFVEDGLEWEPSFNYRIPADASSGLYSLYIYAENLEPFAIPFVVSPTESQKKQSTILVLASTNNWQSYNIWGGRSRYRNYEETHTADYMDQPGIFTELLQRVGQTLPPSIIKKARRVLGWTKKEPEWKFRRLSIKRPFTNCGLEDPDPFRPFTNHLAGGEWRVLAWLEREQYDYDIISGYELSHNPDLLANYEGLVLSTHCEYWSESMYKGVKKYHNQHGLSVFNISGNTLYREVEFFPDGSHRCTSLKFGESVEDETQLIGVRFTVADYGTCAPYKIKEPEHWIFDNLPIHREEDTFGHLSLNQNTPKKGNRYDPGRPGVEFGLQGAGASGWETDKLSKNAPEDYVIVAKGQNKWGGADMVIREPGDHRGGIFSVSSITFGGALLIDEACSQIFKNVLDKFLT